MDDAKHCVTVRDRFHEHTHSKKIVNLVQILVLGDHLLVDAKIMLDAAVNRALDTVLLKRGLDLVHDLRDILLALLFAAVHVLNELVVLFRFQITQRQVIQLDLEARYTQAPGDRRVDVERLARFFLLFLGLHVLEGAHIVGAVRQLDDDDTDVLGHGQEHLAKVLRLLVFLAAVPDQPGQLGHAIDKDGDRLAKTLLEFIERDDGVLHDIMQDARDDGVHVHPKLR